MPAARNRILGPVLAAIAGTVLLQGCNPPQGDEAATPPAQPQEQARADSDTAEPATVPPGVTAPPKSDPLPAEIGTGQPKMPPRDGGEVPTPPGEEPLPVEPVPQPVER